MSGQEMNYPTLTAEATHISTRKDLLTTTIDDEQVITLNEVEEPKTEECKKTTSSRMYCFTLNNYTQEELDILSKSTTEFGLDYLGYGKEISSTGTPHLQGFLHKASKIRFNALKKWLPRASFRVCKGNADQNRKYCSKDGYYTEFGTFPQQGKRNDLKAFTDCIDKGERNQLKLMRDHSAVYAKYPNFTEKYINLVNIENYKGPSIELTEWETELKTILTTTEPVIRKIYWIWSERSAVGKSTFMQHLAAEMKLGYLIVNDLDLKNIVYAYNNHNVIHIDLPRDISDNQRSFLRGTLETLSNGGFIMNSKYTSCVKVIKAHIVVTSNQAPIDGLPQRYVEYKIFDFNNWTKIDHTTTMNIERPTEPKPLALFDQDRLRKNHEEYEERQLIKRANEFRMAEESMGLPNKKVKPNVVRTEEDIAYDLGEPYIASPAQSENSMSGLFDF